MRINSTIVQIMPVFRKTISNKSELKFWPWFCGTGMDDAVTTGAWTDEEAETLVIQPAKAPALAAAAAVGGKGYMPKVGQSMC